MAKRKRHHKKHRRSGRRRYRTQNVKSGCKRVRVSFRARGKGVLTFMARRGPSCGPRRWSAGQLRWRRHFRTVAKKCPKSFKARAKCVASKLGT